MKERRFLKNSNSKCYIICYSILFMCIVLLFTLDLIAVPAPNFSDYSELKKVHGVTREMENEWLPILISGKIKEVRSFHKGLAQKFEVVFQSGHVCSAKPIIPESFWGDTYKTIDFRSLDSKQQRNVRRVEWEYQGWSEIAGYHLDKVLGFHKKPPIVGRQISSKILYAQDESWTGFFKRILPSYNIPMALVPWVASLNRAIPSIPTKNWLTFNNTNELSPAAKLVALNVSDKLVFDFIADDHDTQAAQNWKADGEGRLLHWDTGLGWRDGPGSSRRCLEILCGTKEWKGVSHHDPNPPTCEKVCRFRLSTISRLRTFLKEKEPEKKLGNLLEKSLRDDPLYPVFNMGLYRYYTIDKTGKLKNPHVVHFQPEVFYKGLDYRLEDLLYHVDECIRMYGEEEVYF